MSLFAIATQLRALGLTFVPIPKNNNKRPDSWKWGRLMAEYPTDEDLADWFGGPRPRYDGLALIAGRLSGGPGRALELLDLDDFTTADEVCKLIPPDLLARLVMVKTPRPGGGLHLWYRYELDDDIKPDGNKKLAMRPATPDELEANPNTTEYTIAETRGEGGYGLVPGCGPGVHPDGLYEFTTARTFADLPNLTLDERNLLLEIARATDRIPARPEIEWTGGNKNGIYEGTDYPRGGTPLDDYDNRGDWKRIVEAAGWALALGTWDRGYLRRPGKKDAGVSASLGVCRGKRGESLLRVFSTNAGLKVGAYGKGRAFAAFFHGGNLTEAVRELGRMGFGEPARRPGAHNGTPVATNGTPADGRGAPPPSGPAVEFRINEGFTADKLFEADLPEETPIIDGLLIPGLNLMAGDPKAAKSWLALKYGWAVAGGYSLDGRPTARGDVLFLSLEDTFARMKSRLKMLRPALAWDPPPGLNCRVEWPAANNGGLFYIAEWLTNHPDAKLVIIDTLSLFRGDDGARSNGSVYQKEYTELNAIKKIATARGIAILVIHHTTKLRVMDDPFKAVSGSSAMLGAPDLISVVDRPIGQSAGRIFTRGRAVADSTIYGEFTQATGFWATDDRKEGIDVDGKGSDKAQKIINDCVVWIRDKLRDFAYPENEVQAEAEAAGFKFAVYKEARRAIGRDGTGEIWAHNYGTADKKDYWIGRGNWQHWHKRRPPTPPGEAGPEVGGPDSWGIG